VNLFSPRRDYWFPLQESPGSIKWTLSLRVATIDFRSKHRPGRLSGPFLSGSRLLISAPNIARVDSAKLFSPGRDYWFPLQKSPGSIKWTFSLRVATVDFRSKNRPGRLSGPFLSGSWLLISAPKSAPFLSGSQLLISAPKIARVD